VVTAAATVVVVVAAATVVVAVVADDATVEIAVEIVAAIEMADMVAVDTAAVAADVANATNVRLKGKVGELLAYSIPKPMRSQAESLRPNHEE
jgi:hypothetical protein